MCDICTYCIFTLYSTQVLTLSFLQMPNLHFSLLPPYHFENFVLFFLYFQGLLDVVVVSQPTLESTPHTHVLGNQFSIDAYFVTVQGKWKLLFLFSKLSIRETMSISHNNGNPVIAIL